MTEFVHKFLEWLEDAFGWEGQGEGQVNPMEQLFYGQCQTVGMSEGASILTVGNSAFTCQYIVYAVIFKVSLSLFLHRTTVCE